MPVRMQMRVCRPAYTACDLFIKPDCLKEKKLGFLLFPSLIHNLSPQVTFCFCIPYQFITRFFPPLSTCYRPSATFLFCLELPSFHDSKDTAEHLQRLKVFILFILLPFAPSANSIPHLSAQTSWWEYLAALLTIECSNSLSLTRVQTAGG